MVLCVPRLDLFASDLARVAASASPVAGYDLLIGNASGCGLSRVATARDGSVFCLNASGLDNNCEGDGADAPLLRLRFAFA